jgi:hypothetical protein
MGAELVQRFENPLVGHADVQDLDHRDILPGARVVLDLRSIR